MSYGMEGWGGGFSDPIIDGNGALLVTAEQSPNYVAGVSGWSINQDGTAEFNNLTVRGTYYGSEYIINASGIFQYNGTPALGNLVGSWTVSGGVDQFGNNYNGGFNLANGSGFLELTQNSTNGPQITLSTGNTSISGLNSNIAAVINGFGTSQYDILSISSSRDGNNQDNVRIDLNSSNDVQSVFSAIQLVYAHPSIVGSEKTYIEVNYRGGQIFAGSITAVDPSTGLAYTNAAMPETWHTMVLQNTSVFGTNAGFIAPRYRLEPQGGSTVVRLGGALQLLTANGINESFWQAPTGYQTAHGQHFPVAVKPTSGSATTNYVSVVLGSPFPVALINVGTVGDIIFLDGITYVVN